MYSLALLPLIAATANAAAVMTSPIADSEWKAASRQQVKWDDDGEKPSLKQMGMVQVDLYTGSQTQQTYLATLNTVPATDGVANVEIPKDVGPEGQFYFIRLHAAKEEDRTKDAFSAVFTLSGSTGKFNASISSQLADISASSAAEASKTKAGAGPTTTGANDASPAGTTDSAAPPEGEDEEAAATLARGVSVAAAGAAGLAALLL